MIDHIFRHLKFCKKYCLLCLMYYTNHIVDACILKKCVIFSSYRHLLNSTGSGALLGSLLDHILFNPNLWVKASPKVTDILCRYIYSNLISLR